MENRLPQTRRTPATTGWRVQAACGMNGVL